MVPINPGANLPRFPCPRRSWKSHVRPKWPDQPKRKIRWPARKNSSYWTPGSQYPKTSKRNGSLYIYINYLPVGRNKITYTKTNCCGFWTYSGFVWIRLKIGCRKIVDEFLAACRRVAWSTFHSSKASSMSSPLKKRRVKLSLARDLDGIKHLSGMLPSIFGYFLAIRLNNYRWLC